MILGLDIGFSRVGFAVGDGQIKMAFPREIVDYSVYLEKIGEYIQRESIEKIVVGIPKKLSDTSQKTDHIKKIEAEIKKIKDLYNISVEVFDEQFTTKIVENSLSMLGYKAKDQKNKKDHMAASIILQNYLDARVL